MLSQKAVPLKRKVPWEFLNHETATYRNNPTVWEMWHFRDCPDGNGTHNIGCVKAEFDTNFGDAGKFTDAWLRLLEVSELPFNQVGRIYVPAFQMFLAGGVSGFSSLIHKEDVSAAKFMASCLCVYSMRQAGGNIDHKALERTVYRHVMSLFQASREVAGCQAN